MRVLGGFGGWEGLGEVLGEVFRDLGGIKGALGVQRMEG